VAIKDRNWDDFCVELRKRMFRAGEFQARIEILEIHKLSGTTSSLSDFQKPAYWNACRSGKRNGDGAARSGIEIHFDIEDDGSVQFVTFSLDESRRGTLERFIERRLTQ